LKLLYAADPAGSPETQADSHAVSLVAHPATHVTISAQSDDAEQVSAWLQQSASRHVSHVAFDDE
jgi:hypothetical protein